MFGDQASAMNQQLTESGWTGEQADALVRVIGNCVASLVHRGALTNFGPTNLYGPTDIRGPLDVGPQRSNPRDGAEANFWIPVNFNGSTVDFRRTTTLGLPTSSTFRVGTLDSALTRDGTATVSILDSSENVTGVKGYFVKSGYQAKSGSRVGIIQCVDDDEYYAIVNDDCLEEVP
jgi:hypothetical protein